MTCFHPIEAWKDKGGSIVFTPANGIGLSLRLPCGGCIGCRLDRSRQWAIRCIHEAQLHQENSFITLTYNDEHLPEGRTLVKKHFQDFMKKLRKRFSGRTIRYYHCGEYGESFGRPHYHALLFGLEFPDAILWKESRGHKVFTSQTLEALWGKGFTSIGAVTFESAAYVARYIMKKQNGQYAEHHYLRPDWIDPETGEIFSALPEYTTMSLKPGIGFGWFEAFKNDVYPDDFVVHAGKKHKTPRFYDSLYERSEGKPALEKIKQARTKAAREHAKNQTPARLAVREKVQKAKLTLLKRELT